MEIKDVIRLNQKSLFKKENVVGVGIGKKTVNGKKTDIDSVYQALSIPSNMTVGDVVRGIDDFYGDAANIKLPAVCAYLYFAFKQRGDSGESMEKRLNLWRKMFSR